MFYSARKFSRLTDSKKIRVFNSFIERISSHWDNIPIRTALMDNFHDCIESINDSFPYPDWKTIALSLKGANTAEEFLYITRDIWHNHGRVLRDVEMVSDGVKHYNDQQVNQLTLDVVLENLRSAFNVGSIIRTGECFGVNKFYFCGYTPTPDNEKVKKTSMKTDVFVDWEHRKLILPLLEELKQTKVIIAMETDKTAKNIYDIEIPKPAVLIFGNEADGISEPTRMMADMILKIPVQGWKNSFNVATAFGIACYEVFRQWTKNSKKDV